jgi:RNA polymerase sigma-70 factor (ECF subfamily)
MNRQVEQLKPEDWVLRYGDFLFSVAFFKLSNKEAAEDLVQETFFSALKAKESFKNESSEKTWLTVILKNKIIDYYRKKQVFKHVTQYIQDTENSFNKSFFNENNGHWLDAATPLSWNVFADDKVIGKDFDKVLNECIKKLPTKIVPVFIAKFLDNESSQFICKEFNITPSNYWVMMHRAKVIMRSCLEKNWIET